MGRCRARETVGTRGGALKVVDELAQQTIEGGQLLGEEARMHRTLGTQAVLKQRVRLRGTVVER